MMMAMTKFVKGLGVFIAVALLVDYVYSTSNFVLKHTHWLNAGENAGCADIYSFVDEDMQQRDKTWSVQYRFVDVILWTYDENGEVMCRYASKGISF